MKGGTLKFDLHCHTKVGSIDAKISLEDYIRCLKKQGFGGMMITDHTSTKCWKYWDQIKDQEEFKDFVVIKGVEYDTRDAGHFIVILPEGVHLRLMNIRGLRLKHLIEVVHRCGGILGPAHPFGVKSSSYAGFKSYKKEPHLVKKFDFVEAFNTCESKEANELSLAFAKKHNLPTTAGSDSHKEEYVGMAYTDFDYDIKNNDDMIKAIKQNRILAATGTVREATVGMAMKMHWTAVYGFMAYNVGLGYLMTPVRQFIKKQLFDAI